jgi:hypothetical protein
MTWLASMPYAPSLAENVVVLRGGMGANGGSGPAGRRPSCARPRDGATASALLQKTLSGWELDRVRRE